MKICIPIRETSQNKVKKKLIEAAKHAELAEIWLDGIVDLDLKDLLSTSPIKLVCVCKDASEKGKFTGSQQEQVDVLLEAIEYGAEYVDIPLNMPEKLSKKIVQAASKKRTKIIISHHDFIETPPYEDMLKIAEKIIKKGANIVKIAVTAKNLQNTIDVISLAKHLQGLKVSHILIAMGQKGILSRILTPTLGGEMMFAPMDKKGQTAPGQLTVNELREAWNLITTNS